MKIYIVADMEGIAGVVSFSEIDGRHPGAEQTWARQQFTREVRAVCDGALDAGVEEIVVNDFHGCGRNLQLDLLPQDCMVIRGGFRPTSGFDLLDSTFTGLILLGAHARTGSREGVMPHTWSSHVQFEMFGQPIGEFDLLALVAGSHKVPTLLISGDAKTIEQARTNLTATYNVVTKYGIDHQSALCVHPERVCRQLKEETKRAIKNLKDMEPTVLPTPVQVTVRLENPAQTQRLAWIPTLERLDDCSFAFTAENVTQVANMVYGIAELVEATANQAP